jgi:malonate transporter and related proteins
MSDILRLVIPFFGLVLLGYGAGRFGRLRQEGMAALEFFIFYLAMPALFFRLIAENGVAEGSSWAFVLTTTFSTYCAFAIAFSFGALVNRGNVPEATIQGLVGSYSNVGYLAPALVIAAFGATAAAPMALIFSFDLAMLFTLTPLMMALGGTARANPRDLAEGILRQVLLHPLVIATFLGLVVAVIGFRPPAPVDGLLTLLGAAAAPGALFLVGVNLALRPMGKVTPDMPVLIGVKLLVHPLIVYLLLSWVGGFNRIWVSVAVLIAALPPAANVFMLARQYETYSEQASNAILLASVVGIATVTVVLILLLNNVLPMDPFR